MNIEKVEMFKTSDNALFETEEQAIAHESQNDLWKKAVADYGRYDEVTFAYKDDFFQFLSDNKTEVLRYIGVYVK